MPVISYFFGIYIRMYHADHPPAHSMPNIKASRHLFPSKPAKFLKAPYLTKPPISFRIWAVDHRAELLENWTKARNLEPLQRIPGGDND